MTNSTISPPAPAASPTPAPARRRTPRALRLQDFPAVGPIAVLGIVFLLGGLHAPRAPGGRKAWSLLAFVAAAVGSGYAGRHAWVQLNPPAMPSCGPGLNFIVEQHSWLGAARKVLLATGDCSSIDWQFLGLSMPMWCLVFFVAMGLGALYAGFKRRHHHRFHR